MTPPSVSPEPLCKVLRVEYQALIEGVDVDRAVIVFVLDDEVARKPDSLDLDPAYLATSMYTTDRVMGMPILLSITSLR